MSMRLRRKSMDIPAKLDSASVNSISSLIDQLFWWMNGCASLHSLSSVPMNESLSSEQFLELFVRSQEDLCSSQQIIISHGNGRTADSGSVGNQGSGSTSTKRWDGT